METSSYLKKVLAVLSLAVLVVVGAIFASYTHQYRATNTFEVGEVDITITDTGESASYALTDSEMTQLLIEIKNSGEPCWLRCHTTISADDLETVQTTSSTSEDWILAQDGYLYYTHPIESGETISCPQTIGKPEGWEQIVIKADVDTVFEAIQRANIEPDFSADAPWTGVDGIAQIKITKAGGDQ